MLKLAGMQQQHEERNEERFQRSQHLALDSTDQRPSLGVVGVVFSYPDQGWAGTDTPRMHALQQGSPGVKVCGISLTLDADSCTGISADIRNKRSFPRVFRGMKIGILDYYFLPREYLEPSRIGGGYGCQWFSATLPAFFSQGGDVFFLPNDVSGRVLEMRRDHKDSKLVVALLPMRQCSQHPLFQATQDITNTTAWTTQVHPNLRCKTNELALSTYLNITHPFLVIFKRSQFSSLKRALSYVVKTCAGSVSATNPLTGIGLQT